MKQALSVTFLPVLLVPMVIFLIVAAFQVGEMGQGVLTLSGILSAAIFMERISMSFLMPFTAAVFAIAMTIARLRPQNSQRGLR
ncbi:hypothetical protein K3555_01835 [Leisingera sp. M527]|uniref:hypothetical protein n=1 Tax=Leisingera sp. M527 TaxID=2867014 RepID=UPI0021A8BE81|nr:hypothetical protein [Leisingera sp. M527]UWQ33286.1 hypothetical protein K3555_01835 [Leisingera sp. M527]